MPWGLAFLPGGDVLVTERPGRVRLLRGGVLQHAPVAIIDRMTRAHDEGGLLGIAAHPDFATNRQFFVYFTRGRGERTQNRVERWVLSADGAQRQLRARRLRGHPGARPYHDGGRLRFGPDGMLYVGTGDAREPSRSQDVTASPASCCASRPTARCPRTTPSRASPPSSSAAQHAGLRLARRADARTSPTTARAASCRPRRTTR